jgi:hypothetical protein
VHNQCNQFVYNSIEDGCCVQRNLSFIVNILLLWKHATRPMSRATHADMNHLLEFVRENATGFWGQPRWFHASSSFVVKVDVSNSGEVSLTGDVHLCGFTEQENEVLSQWIQFLGVKLIDKIVVTDQYRPYHDDFLTEIGRVENLHIIVRERVKFYLVDAPDFNKINIQAGRRSFLVIDDLPIRIVEYFEDRISLDINWRFHILCEITMRYLEWWEEILHELLRHNDIKVDIRARMAENYLNEQQHVETLVNVGTQIAHEVKLYYDDDGVRISFQISSARVTEVYFSHEDGSIMIITVPALQPLPRINVAQLNGDYSRQSCIDYQANQNQGDRSHRNQQAREDLLRHNEQVRLNERAAIEALQHRAGGLDAETLTRARDDAFGCHKSNRILESDDPTCNYYVSDDGASAVRYGYRDTFGIGDCIPKDDIVRLRNNCYSRSALSQWFISRRAFRNEHGFGGEALQIPGLGGDAITEAELDALGIRHQ